MSQSSEGGALIHYTMDQTASGESNRRYSTEELLHLRTSMPFVLFNLDILSTDAETSTILHLPEQAKENPSFCIRTTELSKLNTRLPLAPRGGNNSTRNRAGSRSVMASVVEEEEEDLVLYKGHPSRMDYAETKWKLQRRNTSGRSSQPFDAPADRNVQKDENFKAFYQAVVSPTHVRVTAGGRIVPNIRGRPPQQPVFKWDNERHSSDQKKSPITPEEPSFYQQGVNLGSADLQLQGIYPSAPPPYFSGSMIAAAQGDAVDSNSTENTPIQGAPGETSTKPQPATNHPGIQISPAENFDVTKPFWYGDRLIYPQGSEAPAHGLPLNFPANPGMMQPMYPFMPGPFAGPGGQPMFFPPPNHAMGGMHPQPFQYASHPSMMFPGQQPLGNIANGAPVNQAALGLPQFGPQVPQMVPVYDDMRLRLARLREDLRKIENDLQHNAHQIHVPTKMQHRNQCLAEIQRHEAMLSFEMTSKSQRASSSSIASKDPVRKSSSSLLNDSTMNDNARKPVVVDSSNLGDKGARLIESSSEQDATPVPRDQVKAEPRSDISISQDKTSNRARLAAVAATATFEPRSQQPKLQTIEQKQMSDIAAAKAKEEEDRKVIEARLLANAGDWSVPPNMNNVVSLGPPAPYSHIGQNRFRQNQPPMMPRMYPYMPAGAPAHVPFRAPMPSHMVGVPHMAGAPYLRGIQPIGNGEYSYERQLTDDERRARCLYWGRAPHELQRGLPKYNGKDFYPPSPVKVSERSSRSSREPTGQAQALDPFRDIDYSRTNQGVKEDSKDDDASSTTSWGDPIMKHIPTIPTNIAPGHTMPRMSPTKREARSPFTDKVHTAMEEDRRTLASDRQSIGEKRSLADNKTTSSGFLGNMLKDPRYGANTSGVRKEVSSESLGRSFEEKPWLSTSAAASMAPPLSGTITSATARGYLPQYRGTASASLAPNSESPEKYSSLFARLSNADAQDRQLTGRTDGEQDTYLAQNRPQGVKKSSSSRLAAADYLRTVANRDQRENQKSNQSFPRRSGYDASHMGGEGF